MESYQAEFQDLAHQNILITGASRGIGKSIALHLSKQKANILFNYRGDETKAIALKEEFLQAGASKILPLKFDVNNSVEMKAELDRALSEWGPITKIVNNAGISRDGLLLRVKEQDITDTLDTNLKSIMILTQHLTKSLLKAEHVSIVNISSIVGLMGNAGQTSYSASKAGLIGYTKAVAKELASRNVRVNAICPGFIVTDMTNELDEKQKAEYLNSIPLKRLGESQEVSNLVSFLLSRASSYITGETIKIDGGLYI